MGLLLKNKPFIFFLVFLMFVTITHRANDSFVGIFITELGGSADLVGTAWFVAVISEAVVFASDAFWFRKYHPLVFVIVAGILFSIRWFLYGIITNPTIIILLQVIHGFTFAGLYVAAFAYVSRVIPARLQSTGHLIFYSVMFGLSGIIGSMGGGLMIENFSGHALYHAMSILSFIGVLLLSVYYVRIRRAELSS
jgi:MFS family permease